MKALTIVFNPDLSKILLKEINNKTEYTLPEMEIHAKKNPMLFAYEAIKEVFGRSYINMQLWFLKTEVCEGNRYTNNSSSYYIATGVATDAAVMLSTTDFQWVSINMLRRDMLPIKQPNLYGYIHEALSLLNVINSQGDRIS